jgi:hypothetical protein
MVLVFKDPSGWESATSALGQAAGSRLQSYGEERKRKRQAGVLQESLEKATIDPETGERREIGFPEMLEFITKAQAQGISPEALKPYTSLFEKQAGKGSLSTDAEMNLINAGFTPEEINLYRSAPVGGRTAIIKDILEKRLRGQATTLEPREDISNIERVKQEIGDQKKADEVLKTTDVGLTPSERVRRENQRYNTNLKPYTEIQSKVRNLASESRRLDVMEKINETDKLPKGIGRLNVDSMGNLRFPFLSTREAQKYQKLINEFVGEAKDSFGARVTNFELDVFLKRLPTLWNSKEGRAAVLKQMKIVNELNNLYENGRIEGVKKAGGLRKIDLEQADEYTLTKNSNRINQLEKEYRQLESSMEGIAQESDTEKKSLADILR